MTATSVRKIAHLGQASNQRPFVAGWAHESECGCHILEVMWVDTNEPGIVLSACSDEHTDAMIALHESLDDYRPDPDATLHDVVAERFEAVIGRGEDAPTWRTHGDR